EAAFARHQQWCAHVHDERAFEDFGIAANEGGLARDQWAGGIEKAGAGAGRSHRGHVPVDECAGSAGVADIFGSTAFISEASADSGEEEFGRTRPAIDDQEIVLATGD